MNGAGNFATAAPPVRLGWWCAGCAVVALILGFSLGRASFRAPKPVEVDLPSKPKAEHPSPMVLKMQKPAMAAE
jgi:hypothetical protein